MSSCGRAMVGEKQSFLVGFAYVCFRSRVMIISVLFLEEKEEVGAGAGVGSVLAGKACTQFVNICDGLPVPEV